MLILEPLDTAITRAEQRSTPKSLASACPLTPNTHHASSPARAPSVPCNRRYAMQAFFPNRSATSTPTAPAPRFQRRRSKTPSHPRGLRRPTPTPQLLGVSFLPLESPSTSWRHFPRSHRRRWKRSLHHRSRCENGVQDPPHRQLAHRAPDPEHAISHVRNQPRPAQVELCALSNSFAFGGLNAWCA